jgi:hypothetical protein
MNYTEIKSQCKCKYKNTSKTRKNRPKPPLIKSFCGCFTDRSGFSKEPLAAGGKIIVIF